MTEILPAQPRSADAVTAFEQARQELSRSRRAHIVACVTLFVLPMAGSCYVGEVSVPQCITGLPGLLNYIKDITPEIRPRSVLSDLRTWYWCIGRWLILLFDTIVMAFLGTLLGACGAFVLCFSASRNLIRSSTVYFFSRRLAVLARNCCSSSDSSSTRTSGPSSCSSSSP